MISNLYLKLFILLILLVDYQSFPLRKKGKKKSLIQMNGHKNGFKRIEMN